MSVIIKTENLTKHYGDVKAVQSLNLTIHAGEVFGLLGPNGAGKTTTTLMLLGLTDPTSGKAWIDGHDCTREPLLIKRIVGYLPDNVGFYPDMTGRENIVFTGEMNGLTHAQSLERAAGLLERVGMTYAADRKAGTYSRGMRQRLGIADVLMKDPEIIIMDEPTIGLDPEATRELTSLIRELAVKDHRTILLSSHELYQVQQICDRVGIFVEGRMIACGRIDDLGRQLQNEGLYLLDIQTEEDAEMVRRQVLKMSGVLNVTQKDKNSLHIESNRDLRRELIGFMLMNNFTLLDMHQRGGDLEEIYRKYFEKAGENNDAGADENADRAEEAVPEKMGFWQKLRARF